MTNGKYKSAEHRVLASKHKTRMSSATFYDPAPEAMISPLPELVNESNPANYKAIVHGAYVGALYTNGLRGKEYMNDLQCNEK